MYCVFKELSEGCKIIPLILTSQRQRMILSLVRRHNPSLPTKHVSRVLSGDMSFLGQPLNPNLLNPNTQILKPRPWNLNPRYMHACVSAFDSDGNIAGAVLAAQSGSVIPEAIIFGHPYYSKPQSLNPKFYMWPVYVRSLTFLGFGCGAVFRVQGFGRCSGVEA